MQTLEEFISGIKDSISQGVKIELITYSAELIGCDIETEGIELFNSLTTYPRMYWSNPYDGTILTFGQIRKFKANNHDFANLSDFISNIESVHASNLKDHQGIKIFGGFSFDPNGPREHAKAWNSFPSTYFYIPRILIEKYDDRWIVSFNLNMNPELLKNIKSQIESLHDNFFKVINEIIGSQQQAKPVIIRKNKPHTSYETWKESIESIKKLIEIYKLQKLVLANSRKLELSAPLNIIKSLYYLHQHFSDAYIFLFEPIKQNIFLGATPELLITKIKSDLETVALAGSRPRGIIESQDIQYGLELLQSEKDNEEHQFVVDQICEKLVKIGIDAIISEKPTVYKLKNIQHLKTSIKATGEYRLLDVIKVLHPTAAVGGVPSAQSLQLIPELEKMYRGWYAGLIGWIDSSDNGRIVVAIRSSLIKNQIAHIYAGAGIVKNSDAETEWNEIGIKFQPMLKAIGAGRNIS